MDAAFIIEDQDGRATRIDITTRNPGNRIDERVDMALGDNLSKAGPLRFRLKKSEARALASALMGAAAEL